LAIAGAPLLAGFFSKGEILWQSFSSPIGSNVLYGMGLLTAGMTAFYMWRLMFMTFYGHSRVTPEVVAKIHESPRSMTIPLGVLALGSIFSGWIGIPKIWTWFPESFRYFERWLFPVFSSAAVHEAAEEAHQSVGLEWLLMGVSVLIAVIGISTAYMMYIRRPDFPDALGARMPRFHKTLLNKWYLDEIYDFLFVNGLAKGGGKVLGVFDRNVVDGAVNGAGWITRLSSRLSMWWDTWVIDGAVRLSSFLVKVMSYPVRILQTGQVQSYALFIVVGAMVLFGYYMVGR
jgi:NADH-quinone oxidoreductase subunit L